jgi:hypothetical protein
MHMAFENRLNRKTAPDRVDFLRPHFADVKLFPFVGSVAEYNTRKGNTLHTC